MLLNHTDFMSNFMCKIVIAVTVVEEGVLFGEPASALQAEILAPSGVASEARIVQSREVVTNHRGVVLVATPGKLAVSKLVKLEDCCGHFTLLAFKLSELATQSGALLDTSDGCEALQASKEVYLQHVTLFICK